ncbi:histidinol dehydrogenase, partial [Oceanospirillum sp. HFRX-1_2]
LLGQQVMPMDRVGVYVPGGKASYPSSVLMNVIPAKVAGVKEIIMVVPTPRGELNELVLAAACISGVDRVFTIGGAQAVAALAYGTETVPRVDKIVGPGNIFVATAKRMVFGAVGIDMIAGPSEILVVCDGKTDPDWIAMDLFSQAEHDEDAQPILLSWDKDFIDQVEASIEKLMPTMEREPIIRVSMAERAALIQVKDLAEAIEVTNRIAPEHLELSIEDPQAVVGQVRHAGAIFMGRYTAEALGDYCAGPNHVLPTSGTARFSSPLGVYDFQKRSSLIMCSAEGASEMGKIASILARGESLTAHARSAEYRIKD